MEFDFIKAVRNQNKNGYRACVVYIDNEIEVIRASSTRIDSINPNCIIGVYNGKATDAQIIEDTLYHIEQYQQKQDEQSRRLAKALGLDDD